MKVPLEYDEQCALVEWLEIKGLKFTAIPNSTYTTSFNQKRRNYNSGLRKGFPDMIVIIPKEISSEGRTLMLCIEMKRVKGGVVAKEQKEWIKILNEVCDVQACVCKGCDEAVKLVESFIT